MFNDGLIKLVKKSYNKVLPSNQILEKCKKLKHFKVILSFFFCQIIKDIASL